MRPAGKPRSTNNANHLYSSTNAQAGGKPVTVPYLNLNHVLESFAKIDLLKCDIQGGEEAFLKNYPGILRKTRTLTIELHHELCDTAACLRSLREVGFAKMETLREEGGVSVLLCQHE